MIESCNYRTVIHMVAKCMLHLHYLSLLMELCHFLFALHEHITAVSWYKQNKMECPLKVREKDTVVAMQTVIDSHRITERWIVQLICAKWHSSTERKDCWVLVSQQMELQQVYIKFLTIYNSCPHECQIYRFPSRLMFWNNVFTSHLSSK